MRTHTGGALPLSLLGVSTYYGNKKNNFFFMLGLLYLNFIALLHSFPRLPQAFEKLLPVRRKHKLHPNSAFHAAAACGMVFVPSSSMQHVCGGVHLLPLQLGQPFQFHGMTAAILVSAVAQA